MTLQVRVQDPGSASGEDEIEYWRRRSWESIARNALNGISVFGNCSNRSRGLTFFSLISAVKASSFSRVSSAFVESSVVNFINASIF